MEITYRNEKLNCAGASYSDDPREDYMKRIGGELGLKGRDYFQAMSEYIPEIYRKRQYN